MIPRRLALVATLAVVPAVGMLAYAQYTVPNPPPRPQQQPQPYPPQQQGGYQQQPAFGGQPQQGESLAVTELRVGLQKAQIQSALADRVAQVKEDAARAAQARRAANADPNAEEASLNAQADAILARAAADLAKIDANIMDTQFRAGPAAIQQAQAAAQQQQGYGQQPNPLATQIMSMEVQKAQIQAATAARIVPIKQRLYERAAAQQQAGSGTPLEKVSDLLLDLESAKAAQQTTSLDEQLMNARFAAAGGRR